MGLRVLADYHQRIARSFWAAFSILILANIGLGGLIWITPQQSCAIATSRIQGELGSAYQAPLDCLASRVFRFVTDSAVNPQASDLVLYDNGQPLGPQHSLHADIREKGAGRFSHWDAALIFSTTDGTDPRANGRVYSVRGSTQLRLLLRSLLVIGLVIADVAFLVLYRERVMRLVQTRPALFAGAAALVPVLLAALAASGLFGTIIVSRYGPPKDASLVFQVLQHALLGCVTSVGIWAAGAGATRLVLRDPRASLAAVLIPAFPVSILMLAVLTAIALAVQHGRLVALVLWLGCLIPLASWRPQIGQVTAALKTACVAVPFAIAFGTWLAMLWHGPTDTVAGSPSGDLIFYAGVTWALDLQPFPFLDLASANAGSHGYFNFLYPALGAALLHLPNFDPIQFLLASGGASYVLFSALMLHLYVSDRISRPLAALDVVLLILSMVVAARYPYWVAESTPMVFVPALTVAVWWMSERGRTSYGWSVAAMLAGLTASALSKVVTAAVLVPLGSAGIWSRVRELRYSVRLVLVAIVAAFGAYCAAMLWHYLPIFIAYAPLGPESLRTPHWYFSARDIAAMLMIVLAWNVADRAVALCLSFGLLTFLAYSWVFQANFVCVCILLGLISASSASSSSRLLALAAFVLSLPALILGEQATASSGFVWIACVGGASLVAVVSASDLTMSEPKVTVRRTAALTLTALAIVALGLAGVARGLIIADSGWHPGPSPTLTPAVKQIWSAVRERTPKDALIFTDQVDETEDLLGGWNTYALVGQRQIFLSSHITDPTLRYDKGKIRDVLAINGAVLDGSRSPENVPTKRSYGSYYAVVRATSNVPPSWRETFRNNQYALYQIIDR
jgi:hypothetical protein